MPADSGLIQNDPGTVVPQETSRQNGKIRDEYYRVGRKRLFYNLINSTSIYILTYLTSYLFYQLITMVCAYLVGIHSVLYYYEIVFGIANDSPEWTPARTGVIYLIAPVFSLITGSLILFRIVKRFSFQQYHKLFLLWLGFHLLNFFFSGIIAGSITGHGIGYALDIAFWPVYFIYVILSLSGILCLVLVGNDITEHFLKTNPSNYWSKRKIRSQYLLYTVGFPWLIGSYLIVLIKFPDQVPQHESITVHDLILTLSMIFLILPMFYRTQKGKFRSKTISAEKKQNILWLLLISTIVLVIFFRLGLTSFFYSLFT